MQGFFMPSGSNLNIFKQSEGGKVLHPMALSNDKISDKTGFGFCKKQEKACR